RAELILLAAAKKRVFAVATFDDRGRRRPRQLDAIIAIAGVDEQLCDLGSGEIERSCTVPGYADDAGRAADGEDIVARCSEYFEIAFALAEGGWRIPDDARLAQFHEI